MKISRRLHRRGRHGHGPAALKQARNLAPCASTDSEVPGRRRSPPWGPPVFGCPLQSAGLGAGGRSIARRDGVAEFALHGEKRSTVAAGAAATLRRMPGSQESARSARRSRTRRPRDAQLTVAWSVKPRYISGEGWLRNGGDPEPQLPLMDSGTEVTSRPFWSRSILLALSHAVAAAGGTANRPGIIETCHRWGSIPGRETLVPGIARATHAQVFIVHPACRRSRRDRVLPVRRRIRRTSPVRNPPSAIRKM